MEHTPQVKHDEQYPLLKVESGGGDAAKKGEVPSAIASSGWHVTCAPKQTWCNRWPGICNEKQSNLSASRS